MIFFKTDDILLNTVFHSPSLKIVIYTPSSQKRYENKCLVSYVQIQNAINHKYHCYNYRHMSRFLYKAFTLLHRKLVIFYYICDFSSENIPHLLKLHSETSILHLFISMVIYLANISSNVHRWTMKKKHDQALV